jgi:hypothetical protein
MTKETREKLIECLKALENCKDENLVRQIVDELEDTISLNMLF